MPFFRKREIKIINKDNNNTAIYKNILNMIKFNIFLLKFCLNYLFVLMLSIFIACVLLFQIIINTCASDCFGSFGSFRLVCLCSSPLQLPKAVSACLLYSYRLCFTPTAKAVPSLILYS
jgi:uncharacterized membrane protein